MDKTVRLWDLSAGMPVGASRPHGGIVRAVTLDPRALATGCSDTHIRVWGAGGACGADAYAYSCGGGGGGGGGAARKGGLFDLTAAPKVLKVGCCACGEGGGDTEVASGVRVACGPRQCNPQSQTRSGLNRFRLFFLTLGQP